MPIDTFKRPRHSASDSRCYGPQQSTRILRRSTTSTGRSSRPTSSTRSPSMRAPSADLLDSSIVKSARPALSIPMFWSPTSSSRKWFNELFYRYYAGRAGRSPGRARRGAVRGRHQAEHLSARARSDRAVAPRRLPPGAGLGRARLHGAAARALSRRRRLHRQQARVRQRLCDRQSRQAVRRRRDQGRHHARVRRAARHRSRRARRRTPIRFSDYPMLAVVGHPTACNPDFRLRATRAQLRLARARSRRGSRPHAADPLRPQAQRARPCGQIRRNAREGQMRAIRPRTRSRRAREHRHHRYRLARRASCSTARTSSARICRSARA